MTAQKESPGEAGRGFRGYRGGDPVPQENHEANCQNCQDIPEPADLLKELFFVHLNKWAEHTRKVRELSADLERIRGELAESLAKADAEMAEAGRLQRLAQAREVEA